MINHTESYTHKDAIAARFQIMWADYQGDKEDTWWHLPYYFTHIETLWEEYSHIWPNPK